MKETQFCRKKELYLQNPNILLPLKEETHFILIKNFNFWRILLKYYFQMKDITQKFKVFAISLNFIYIILTKGIWLIRYCTILDFFEENYKTTNYKLAIENINNLVFLHIFHRVVLLLFSHLQFEVRNNKFIIYTLVLFPLNISTIVKIISNIFSIH